MFTPFVRYRVQMNWWTVSLVNVEGHRDTSLDGKIECDWMFTITRENYILYYIYIGKTTAFAY